MSLIFWAFLIFYVDVDGNVGHREFTFVDSASCEAYKNEGLSAFLNENHERLGVASAHWRSDLPCQRFELSLPERPLDQSQDGHSH